MDASNLQIHEDTSIFREIVPIYPILIGKNYLSNAIDNEERLLKFLDTCAINLDDLMIIEHTIFEIRHYCRLYIYNDVDYVLKTIKEAAIAFRNLEIKTDEIYKMAQLKLPNNVNLKRIHQYLLEYKAAEKCTKFSSRVKRSIESEERKLRYHILEERIEKTMKIIRYIHYLRKRFFYFMDYINLPEDHEKRSQFYYDGPRKKLIFINNTCATSMMVETTKMYCFSLYHLYKCICDDIDNQAYTDFVIQKSKETWPKLKRRWNKFVVACRGTKEIAYDKFPEFFRISEALTGSTFSLELF